MNNQEAINKINILGRIKEGLDAKIGENSGLTPVGNGLILTDRDKETGKYLDFTLFYSLGKEVPIESLKINYRWNISDSVIWAINKNKRRFEATIKESEALSKDIQESFFKKYHIKQEDITPENEVETNEKFQTYLASEAVIKLQRDFLEAENTVEWYKALDVDWDKLTCPDAIRQFLEITLR